MFPLLYKGAFVVYEQSLHNKRNAKEYWLNELATKDRATVKMYKRYFEDFLTYLNTDADKLLQQRIEHSRHEDIKVQRTIESYFLQFLRDLRVKKEYKNGTLQVVFASIRSFFEMHYVPLRTRRKDYPKSTANGVRRATDEAIRKVLTEYKPRNRETFKALLMTFKDTGLRVIDLIGLNCDVILDNEDKEFIPLTVRTEKTGLIAKTFLGSDAIEALKEYKKGKT
jgi:integrase